MNLLIEVNNAKSGNKDSFIKLIKHFEPSMYKVANSILKFDNDCADAIQETIIKAYKNITKLKHPEFFKTWLIRILINECNNLLKHKKKIIPMEKVTVSKLSNNDIGENIEIEELLNLLDQELKTVVVLYYFEDLSIKDISEVLSIPQGTVKSRLSRARHKLAALIKEDFEGSACHE